MTKDIVYAKGLQPDNPSEWKRTENAPVEWKLDEYAPTEPGPWPAVVLVNYSGEARALPGWAALGKMIAEQGAFVFAIDYPDKQPELAILDNGRGYREMAETVACAVRFARARVSGSRSDAVRVTLVGFCLGGGAAAQVALAGESLDSRWDAYTASSGGPPRQVGCEVSGGSPRVNALVGIAGAYDIFLGYDGLYDREWRQRNNPDLWKMFSSFVGENPGLHVRLLHSKTDATMPYDNSVAFEAILVAAGYDVKLIEFRGSHEVPLEGTFQTVMSAFGDQSQ